MLRCLSKTTFQSLLLLQEIGYDVGGQEESTADSGAEKSVIHPENMVSPVREKVCKLARNRLHIHFEYFIMVPVITFRFIRSLIYC